MVGAIGLGCMSFGGPYGPTTEAECFRTLARAHDLGVTHLDTANIYGNGVSEQTIGAYIARSGHEFVIATKAGIINQPVRRYDNSEAHIRSSLEDSLRRLGREHVELFYIHRREADRPIEEVMETLARLKQEGKIGAIGLSEVSPGTLERAQAIHPVAAVQSEYSLWTRLPDLGLIRACETYGTAFVAFSPVARGMLTGRIPDPRDFADTDFRKASPRFIEPNYSLNLKRIQAFNAFARDTGRSPAALAIAWVLHRTGAAIPIPGTRTAEHLEEDVAAADMVLTASDIATIEELLPVGFAHGDRYSDRQASGPERYC
ncbi:aryl-alcohol dehydrogenase-like predicted oxidoreductase [Hoeflea marina]|uniref:Aryl-alcohol dehydrogenase-like predicted oxidoreductase n=2 Tax=Hoeflea marina TaxID=274592 RepID=A0A317PHZ5_9HYPH|nr:aryl-alcohol dehydrogenase-like predicted oxidoreductase [Hoeflea marina]